MPLTIIKGHYRIVGSEPDGDSVRFYPLDRNAFTTLHLRARVNRITNSPGVPCPAVFDGIPVRPGQTARGGDRGGADSEVTLLQGFLSRSRWR
jgi:hypothetical protein